MRNHSVMIDYKYSSPDTTVTFLSYSILTRLLNQRLGIAVIVVVVGLHSCGLMQRAASQSLARFSCPA